MILIGITGTRGSGKGTVAQYVAEWATEHGLLSVDRGFADKLKWAMARIFWPKISMENAIEWANDLKNKPHATVRVGDISVFEYAEFHSITGRQLFQHGGTEMGREIFGSDFWVDQLLPYDRVGMGSIEFPLWCWNFLKQGATEPEKTTIATISDLRFSNEADRIKSLGGSIWEVHRPGFESDGHASEEPLPRGQVSVSIGNSGSLDDLRASVFALCDKQIRGGKG